MARKKKKNPVVPEVPVAQKSSFGFWIALSIVLLAAIFLNAYPINDSDFFWHLETGEQIFKTGSIPNEDIFSHTAEGHKWITHEWLFEAVTWLVYSVGSFEALCILRILAVCSVLFITLTSYRNRPVSPIWILISGLLGLVILNPRTDWRPLLLTILFFSAYLVILENFLEKRSEILWPLPIMMLIWANWHSGMLFGLLLVAYYTVVVYLFRDGRESHEQQEQTGWVKLAVILALCIAASIININGLNAHIYPIKLGRFYTETFLDSNVIGELQVMSLEMSPGFWLSLVLIVIALVISRGKWKWHQAIILIGLAAASIYRLRLVELYTPALLVFAPGIIQAASSRITTRFKGLPGGIIIAAVAVLVFLTSANLAWHSSKGPFALGIQEDFFPVGTADWIEEFSPPGLMYNNFGYGGYLSHRFYPERKIFWDGRLMVFEELHERLARGEGINDIRECDYAVIDRRMTGDNPYTPDEWALVAFDTTSSLYLHRDRAARDLIAEHEYFLLVPFKPADTLRNVSDAPEEMKEGLLRELDRYLAENQTAYARSLAIRCYIMLGGEHLQRARELLVEGMAENSTYYGYWHSSALYYLAVGDLDNSDKAARAVLLWWPDSVEVKFILGKIQAERGDHRASVSIFRKVIDDGYTVPEAWLELAKSEYETGNAVAAIEALDAYFTNVAEFDRQTGEYAEAIAFSRELVGE